MKYKMELKGTIGFDKGYWYIYSRKNWWPFWTFRMATDGTAEDVVKIIELMSKHDPKIYPK